RDVLLEGRLVTISSGTRGIAGRQIFCTRKYQLILSRIVALAAEISKSRRWTVLASGFLCGVLALVVLFTSPRAFHSPIAVLVVACIGFVALLMQLRLDRGQAALAHPHTWLNSIGMLLAVGAVVLDFLGSAISGCRRWPLRQSEHLG